MCILEFSGLWMMCVLDELFGISFTSTTVCYVIETLNI